MFSDRLPGLWHSAGRFLSVFTESSMYESCRRVRHDVMFEKVLRTTAAIAAVAQQDTNPSIPSFIHMYTSLVIS